MIVVDTSAWIEWLVDGPAGSEIGRKMPERSRTIVPTLVQLELAKWLQRERDEEASDRILAFTQKCEVVALDTRIAISAAGLCRRHGLATADAIIYATAIEKGARLLTCDSHFMDLPGVDYVPKAG